MGDGSSLLSERNVSNQSRLGYAGSHRAGPTRWMLGYMPDLCGCASNQTTDQRWQTN